MTKLIIKFCFPSHGQIKEIFQDEDPERALEAVIDGSLHFSYPFEAVYKVCQNLGSHGFSIFPIMEK